MLENEFALSHSRLKKLYAEPCQLLVPLRIDMLTTPPAVRPYCASNMLLMMLISSTASAAGTNATLLPNVRNGVVGSAVQYELHLLGPASVDRPAGFAVERMDRLIGERPGGEYRARSKHGHRERIARTLQRQFRHRLIVDDQTAVALFGFQQRRFARYGDAVRQISNLERDVNHRREIHLQLDILADKGSEPRTLHGQTIRAGIEKQESILPCFIGLGLEGHTGLAVGEADNRCRNYRAGGICNGAAEGGTAFLGLCNGCEQSGHREGQHEATASCFHDCLQTRFCIAEPDSYPFVQVCYHRENHVSKECGTELTWRQSGHAVSGRRTQSTRRRIATAPVRYAI